MILVKLKKKKRLTINQSYSLLRERLYNQWINEGALTWTTKQLTLGDNKSLKTL